MIAVGIGTFVRAAHLMTPMSPITSCRGFAISVAANVPPTTMIIDGGSIIEGRFEPIPTIKQVMAAIKPTIVAMSMALP